jgi:hypothetical protein
MLRPGFLATLRGEIAEGLACRNIAVRRTLDTRIPWRPDPSAGKGGGVNIQPETTASRTAGASPNIGRRPGPLRTRRDDTTQTSTLLACVARLLETTPEQAQISTRNRQAALIAASVGDARRSARPRGMRYGVVRTDTADFSAPRGHHHCRDMWIHRISCGAEEQATRAQDFPSGLLLWMDSGRDPARKGSRPERARSRRPVR